MSTTLPSLGIPLSYESKTGSNFLDARPITSLNGNDPLYQPNIQLPSHQSEYELHNGYIAKIGFYAAIS